MQILWVLEAILATFSAVGLLLFNHHFKANGFYLIFWSSLWLSLFFLPFLGYAVWPSDPIFYGAVLINGLVNVYGDIKILDAVAKFGAGVVSRLLPLGLWVSFLGWFLLQPSEILPYLNTPMRSLGICLALAGVVYFAGRLKHCSYSKSALSFLLLPILISGFGPALNKLAMVHSPLHSGVFLFIFLQSLVKTLTALIILPQYQKSRVDSSEANKIFLKTFWIGGVVAVLFLLHAIPKTYSMVGTPNPSFVEAIILTTPLWVFFVLRLFGAKERGNIRSGMLLVLCCFVLIILTLN